MKPMNVTQVNAPELPNEVEDAYNREGVDVDAMTNPMLNITMGSTGEATSEGDVGGAKG